MDNPDGVEQGVRELFIDGQPQAERLAPLADDGRVHEVRVVMGS